MTLGLAQPSDAATKKTCTNSTSYAARQDYVNRYSPGPNDSRGIGIVIYEAVRNDLPQVQLAAFETAWVESVGIHNLPDGDCDSLGVFQQRPSQGWCANEFDCLDIRQAVQKFRIGIPGTPGAVPYAAAHPSASADVISQGVQKSEFPTRYRAAETSARRELELARNAYQAMSGTGAVAGSPVGGFWLVQPDGTVHNYAGAQFYGDMHGIPLSRPIVGIAATPSGLGYWLVGSDGGVFSFGDAQFYGSMGAAILNKPVVGMTATPTGLGYWLVASDGGVFSFGDAHFAGSTGAMTLNKPVVGMTASPSGLGYWLVASDGGIFSFGDAQFHGSTGSMALNKPVVGMAATPTGGGYWLVASDGGIFSFGDAQFHGSTGSMTLAKPISGMASTKSGGGYWLVESDGATVFAFGDAAPAATAHAQAHATVAAADDQAVFGPVTVWNEDGSAVVDLTNVRPGMRLLADVTIRNVGVDAWVPSGYHPTRLVTANGGPSPLANDARWIDPSTPGLIPGSYLPSGATSVLTIPLVAPAKPGAYTQSFQLENAGLGQFTSAPLALTVHVVSTPSAPRRPTAGAHAGAVTVGWKAPASKGGAKLTGYLVTPFLQGKALPARIVAPNARSVNFRGLKPGEVYSFGVAAQNKAGVGPASVRSNAVKAK